MFNIYKSRYLAVLLKQRRNTKPLEKKWVPSALNWNYWSYIFNNKSCLATSQRALPKRHTAKEKWQPKRGFSQCWAPVRIVYKDNFKIFFQMTMLFLAYVVTFLGQVHFMRNCFFTVNIPAEQLLLQSN